MSRPSARALQPSLASLETLEVSTSRDTELMEARASPRKPRLPTCSRSVSSRILLVAWRCRASSRSWRSMPWPSSRMRSSLTPPASTSMSMCRAPASRLFSSSSLMTEAGLSTTSPAAIWLARRGGRVCIRDIPYSTIQRGGAVAGSDTGDSGNLQRLPHAYPIVLQAVAFPQGHHADLVAAGNFRQRVAAHDAVFPGSAIAAQPGQMGIRRGGFIEMPVDATEDRPGKPLLVGPSGQPARLFRVGDKAGLHQDGGDVGGLQHGKGRLFHPSAVEVGDLGHVLENMAADAHAGLQAGGHGQVGENAHQVVVLALDHDSANRSEGR